MLLSKEREEEIRRQLSSLFDGMMRTLYSLKGSEFRIGILAKPKVQEFVEAHAGVLDSGFSRVEMSETMRRRLTRSDYVFSGIKTFHELREAFPSLLDGNGKRKPFEQFLNDVRKIDETYNSNYLRAEYNFVQASAEMAARWEQFAEDGDRYNLQYRTAADGKVRPAHAALHGVTLPITDPFWEEYYPPNGWNCRCTVVQVRKSKYPETPHDEAMALGEEALQKDSKGMFRFNAGKERKTVPDYNPYTIRRCRDCDVAKGKLKLAFVPDNELCQACRIIRQCAGNREKTQRAVERTHYLHEMEPLLKKSVAKTAGDKNLNVGFTKYGNKHLFSDTFGRSSILRKDDLASLDEVLKGAEFIDGSALTHPRTDDIVHFYYFKAQIRGLWVRLNVAKQVYRRPSGQVEIRYFMYSINDI